VVQTHIQDSTISAVSAGGHTNLGHARKNCSSTGVFQDAAHDQISRYAQRTYGRPRTTVHVSEIWRSVVHSDSAVTLSSPDVGSSAMGVRANASTSSPRRSERAELICIVASATL
jgi:hypothetical protein